LLIAGSSSKAAGADAVDMGDEAHEGIFGHVVIAFVQGDFGMMRSLMREDVVLTLVGSSPLAGTHHGRDAVARLAIGLGRYVMCTSHQIRFAHDGDRMTAHREIAIRAHLHHVEMTLHASFSFDRSDRIGAVQIEPSDPGLFDHVISVEIAGETGSGSLRIPELPEDQRVERTSSTAGDPATPRRRGHL
jgi:ketosteroid isomerase-like protein